MCGIVGAVAERNVVPILMEGLRRLEYRGYDSAGLAVLEDNGIERLRRAGKVQELADALEEHPIGGSMGISHTRWATHGAPNEANAHPHMSGDDVVLVHNGIIENYQTLREELETQGFEFSSDTDTEVVAHRVSMHLKESGDIEYSADIIIAPYLNFKDDPDIDMGIASYRVLKNRGGITGEHDINFVGQYSYFEDV